MRAGRAGGESERGREGKDRLERERGRGGCRASRGPTLSRARSLARDRPLSRTRSPAHLRARRPPVPSGALEDAACHPLCPRSSQVGISYKWMFEHLLPRHATTLMVEADFAKREGFADFVQTGPGHAPSLHPPHRDESAHAVWGVGRRGSGSAQAWMTAMRCRVAAGLRELSDFVVGGDWTVLRLGYNPVAMKMQRVHNPRCSPDCECRPSAVTPLVCHVELNRSETEVFQRCDIRSTVATAYHRRFLVDVPKCVCPPRGGIRRRACRGAERRAGSWRADGWAHAAYATHATRATLCLSPRAAGVQVREGDHRHVDPAPRARRALRRAWHLRTRRPRQAPSARRQHGPLLRGLRAALPTAMSAHPRHLGQLGGRFTRREPAARAPAIGLGSIGIAKCGYTYELRRAGPIWTWRCRCGTWVWKPNEGQAGPEQLD